MSPARRHTLLRLLILASLAVMLGGCTSVPRVAASGQIAGYRLRGPVDHRVARDYLEGRTLPQALRDVRRQYLSAGEVPSRDAPASISQQYSPDVATLLLLETLSAQPEIRDLRARYEAELALVRRVVGWPSIVGAVRGSPLADRVLEETELCWLAKGQLALEGFGLDGLRSMQASRVRRAFEGLRFPPHVRIFALMAVPLSGYISDRASLGYRETREFGPNDGLTLLVDEVIPGAALPPGGSRARGGGGS
jgi:hypothetical protein